MILLAFSSFASAPVILINEVGMVDEGATQVLTIDALKATDTETLDADLVFTGIFPARNGTVLLSGSFAFSFTQQQIIDGLVSYRHNRSNTTKGSLIFKVSDGTEELLNQVFHLQINPIDDDTATLYSNKGLTLDEGTAALIPLDSLEVNDPDTDDSTLLYTVRTSALNGKLENTDNLGFSISSFTQQNLVDGKVRYLHNGSNTPSDSFSLH